MYTSTRLQFNLDSKIVLGGRQITLDYNHDQTEIDTQLFLKKLNAIDHEALVLNRSINSLQAFQRQRLALDCVDDMLSRAKAEDIQEMAEICEKEVRGMEKTSLKAIKEFLVAHQYGSDAREQAKKVEQQVAKRLKEKRSVLEKVKSILARKTS